MSLVSIVAREDFISVVTDFGNQQMMGDYVRFKEIIPDTAFIAFAGDEEYACMAMTAADTLVKQGFTLKEIAESIQSSIINKGFNFYESGRGFEAVIAGYSLEGEAQYHIVSNSKPLESYYPGTGESLYYANGAEPMLVLERSLKMHGMGTVDQAQAAQIHLLKEAAKFIPNINTQPTTHVLKKAH
ncbi:hypothetical protein [Mesobacillus subterraneus]|uniref:Uncharacterized protein n=1 Tax=Mesobacillus subterraneus TaxID=285983 RepID=A0A427TKQ8_9BACI|nr:hypothetical protein [Mesobacillus subterraneus]RSD24457.1 hypothetical protein EJA10_19445 [Mesobacillus subterraneus]